MSVVKKVKAIPGMQKYRYLWIMLSCLLFLSPFLVIPTLVGNSDMCGKLCMRRFYLYFPGMDSGDLWMQMQVAIYGVIALALILLTTFFFGRIWCGFLCPMGGLPELVSRLIPDRWKIEFRSLPQVPIRYGYFGTYVVLMPALGISACTLCNFITIPRLFESFSGGLMGLAFIFSSVGFVNLLLLFLLGFFANKGRAYCQFLCPIGAIDGVVNRMGSRFRFTHRIRVERDRCSGCNVCARKCMTGAIKMVDKIAVVDQLSCMSCHECVDVCDWDAIKWTNAPKTEQPKRVKRDVEIHPLPMWTSVYHPHKQKKGIKKFNWGRIIAGGLFAVIVSFALVSETMAAERNSDPDGCLVCHALPDLTYIDKQGLQRNGTIDTKHYLSSLHGSVACTDCHQNLQYYPHQEENVSVDCAASCHLDEPSKGEAYSHKEVTEEFQQSVHNQGWSKGLTGGNRLKEHKEESPSCRFCHSNTSYVPEHLMTKFKETFAHTETECGSCHQGEVWLNQFSGHILRRLIGARWSKTDEVAMCNDCHDNPERIQDSQRHDYSQTPVAVDAEQQSLIGEFANHYASESETSKPRFDLASKSYAMTLHARLLKDGVDEGASCLECHAPNGFNHGIQSKYDPRSPTHLDNLAKTCGSANCHTFSEHPDNQGFVSTDLHDIDMLSWLDAPKSLLSQITKTPWGIAVFLLASFLLLALTINIVMDKLSNKGKKAKKDQGAFLGGSAFDKHILNLKAKPPAKSSAKAARKTVAKANLRAKPAVNSAAEEACPLANKVNEESNVEATAGDSNKLDSSNKEAKRIAALAKAKAKKRALEKAKAKQADSQNLSVNAGELNSPVDLEKVKQTEKTDSEKLANRDAVIAKAKAKAKAKAIARAAAAKADKEQS